MKKKIAIIAAACALALALPVMAWAGENPSPTTKTDTASFNGVTLTFTYTGDVTVTGVSGTPEGMTSSESCIAGFQVSGTGSIVSASITAPSQYANCHYRILVNGVLTSGYFNSSATAAIDLSSVQNQTFYVVADPSDKASTDTSSVSPQTGANPYVFAGIAGVALVAAAGVTMLIRRREAE